MLENGVGEMKYYDAHLYSNRKLSSRWESAFHGIPSHSHTISIDVNKKMHQEGAIRAFAFSRVLFQKYEWVIRTNPDVHVVNPGSFSGWMENPRVHAILANCNPDVECVASCERAIVHTDFTIFRPHFLEWGNASTSNAEMHMSRLMRPVLLGNNVRWLQGKGYRDRSCRIRAGVREHNTTVIHNHLHTQFWSAGRVSTNCA